MKNYIKYIIILSSLSLICGCASNKTSSQTSIQDNTSDQVHEEYVAIDNMVFPDAAFRDYVSQNIDQNADGLLEEDEIELVNKIELYGREDDESTQVHDLKGVEVFTELEDLTCTYCGLENLDVTNNTSLKYICIIGNPISELDVSNNSKLVSLSVASTNLSSIDVHSNELLEELDVHATKIAEITLDNNLKLIELNCGNTLITRLNVSNNKELQVLTMPDTNIESINLNNNIKLETLVISNTKIVEIDLSQNVNLQYLECLNSNIGELHLEKNDTISDVYCYDGTIVYCSNDNVAIHYY